MIHQRRDLLNSLSPSDSRHVVHNACAESLSQLFNYLPIMGFILRSTNVRNAFEICPPLLWLARQALGESAKLVISSEWEYSPFVYRPIDDLPGFVLIGLPASESSNPMLIPLAGHELGHSVWQSANMAQDYESFVGDSVVKRIRDDYWDEYKQVFPHDKKDELESNWVCRLNWGPAYNWALLQVEEIFCDILGLRMFAEAYLHAFAYLLAPRTHGQRSVNYPNKKKRVEYLVTASTEFMIAVPDDFQSSFENEDPPVDPACKILVRIADEVSESFVDDLTECAKTFAADKEIPERSPEEVDGVVASFEQIVPASSAKSVVDIVNAGWKCFLNPALWKNEKQIEPESRRRILRDLVLKNLEVFEIERRLR